MNGTDAMSGIGSVLFHLYSRYSFHTGLILSKILKSKLFAFKRCIQHNVAKDRIIVNNLRIYSRFFSAL